MTRRNPRIKEVEVGITKGVSNLKIYPLSLAAETRIFDMFDEVRDYLKEQAGGSDNWMDNVKLGDLIEYGISFICKNLKTVLEFVTHGVDVDELVKEIDNAQAVEIAETIYKVNFEGLKKKVETIVDAVTMGMESQETESQETDQIK